MEGFASKKEFDRHTKTASHKEKETNYRIVEEQKKKCPPGSFVCPPCQKVVKRADCYAHNLEHHGSFNFKSLSEEKKVETVQVHLTHYLSEKDVFYMKKLMEICK